MLLQDVKELINNLEFDKAISELEEIILTDDNSEIIEAYQLLLYLLEFKNPAKFTQVEKKYFNHLEGSKNFESLYTLLKTKSVSESLKDFDQMKAFLEVLWALGRVQEFTDEVKKINFYLLENKRTNKFEEFYQYVTSKTNKFDFLNLGYLVYCVDTHDSKKIEKHLEYMLEAYIYSNKYDPDKRKKMLASLKSIIEDYSSEDASIYYYQLYLEVISSTLNGEPIQNKKIIEFLLLLKKGVHGSYLLELDIPHEVKEDILNYLKMKFQMRKNQLPSGCRNAKTYFETTVVVTTKKMQEKDLEKRQVLQILKTKILNNDDTLNLNIEGKRPKQTQLEKELMTQFEHENWDGDQIKSLVVSFMEMDMNHLARKIASKLPESGNKKYLLAELSLRLNEFADVIFICNEAIDLYKLKDDEILPFLYLKQKAYEYGNKKIEEREILKQIAKLNPNFMNARGKLNL